MQHLTDGKLVQDHAYRGQEARQDADRERDRVDTAVDEGMKTDAEHLRENMPAATSIFTVLTRSKLMAS